MVAVVAAVGGALLVAYLLGTFPTAELVTATSGRDVTNEGSGNPGASNTYRVAGRKAGALVLVGDLLKGALASVFGLAVGGLIDPGGPGYRILGYACGLAAVVGHCWPLLRLGKGGRGVASGGGTMLMLEPVITVVAFLSWLAVAKLSRAASLASLGLCIGIPLAIWLLGRPLAELGFAVVIAAIIVLRHLPNIQRLRRGEERSRP